MSRLAEAVSGGVLERVERGETLDVVELIDAAGNVFLVHAHGVDGPERARTREAVLKLLRGRLAPAKTR
jgi:hypothetical protein